MGGRQRRSSGKESPVCGAKKTTVAEGAGIALEYVSPEELQEHPKNARAHNSVNLEAIAASLKEFGQVEPLVVQKGTGYVIGGNGRLQVIRSLGWKRVPVVRLDIDDIRAKALGLALNRTAELATWNPSILEDTINELESAGFPTDGIGFNEQMLDELLKDAGGGAPAGDVEEDEAPEPPKVATTKKGDVWTLGRHRLVCGDIAESAKVVFDQPWRLLVTDPPYGVSYADKNEFLNELDGGKRVEKAIENDQMTPEEMSALWCKCFDAVRPHGAPGSSYYVTGPQGGELLLLLLALRDSGYPLRHMIIWAKNGLVFGRCDYHYQHEPILYGWIEGAAHKAVANRSETSLWQIDRPTKSDLHPTMKPVELYARAMRNSSEEGWIVAEPFAGSGTAFVAAEQLGRCVRGCEIDERYCDVIVERWQNLTGGKAQRSKG